MYIGTTRRWIAELRMDGKLAEVDEGELEKLANDYALQLEKLFTDEIKLQMEKYGKAEEFERMLLYDSQYMNKYLNQTIPAYPSFRLEIFSKARKAILGDAE